MSTSDRTENNKQEPSLVELWQQRLESATIKYEELYDKQLKAQEALKDRGKFRDEKALEIRHLKKTQVPGEQREERRKRIDVAVYELSIEQESLKQFDRELEELGQQVSKAFDVMRSAKNRLAKFSSPSGDPEGELQTTPPTPLETKKGHALMSEQGLWLGMLRPALVAGGIVTVFGAVYFIGHSLGTLSTKTDQTATQLSTLKNDLNDKIEGSSNNVSKRIDDLSSNVSTQVSLIDKNANMAAERIEKSLLAQLELTAKVTSSGIALSRTEISNALESTDDRLGKLETHARSMFKRSELMTSQLRQVLAGQEEIRAALKTKKLAIQPADSLPAVAGYIIDSSSMAIAR